MSSRDYVSVPGFPALRVCVRPFAPHSPTIALCYVGPMANLIAAGIATHDMLTTAKSGLDAAGDHYTTDAHWSTHRHGAPRRYRIWRRVRRARVHWMPGAHEALAHAAAQARVTQRLSSDTASATASSPARTFQNVSG
jgi:hypothetical protein